MVRQDESRHGTRKTSRPKMSYRPSLEFRSAMEASVLQTTHAAPNFAEETSILEAPLQVSAPSPRMCNTLHAAIPHVRCECWARRQRQGTGTTAATMRALRCPSRQRHRRTQPANLRRAEEPPLQPMPSTSVPFQAGQRFAATNRLCKFDDLCCPAKLCTAL